MSERSKRAVSLNVNERAQGRDPVEEILALADLEQASANYESAVRSYRQALEVDTTPSQKARALKGVGSCLERIGRWKEALNVLEDAAAAARTAEDSAELGRVLIKLGKIHLGQGAIDTALRCGTEAMELIDPKTDPSSRGFALNLLGSAHNRRGDLETSASCFEQALSSFKGAGDVRSLSLAYNNLGLIYKEKCDWRRAMEYLQVASSLQAIEGEFPERHAGGLHNLGIVHFKMGHWDRARDCFGRSLKLCRSVNDPLGVIRALVGMAGVDLALQQWDQALESLEQALELCSEEQYPRETALTYRSLGQLHQARGDFARARRCLEVAWRKSVEISPEGDLARELLRLRSDLSLAEGKTADAANLAQRAEELSSRGKDRMETALAKLTRGRVLLAQGEQKGYELLAESESLLERLGSPYPLALARLDEGRLRLRYGHDLARAETVLAEALAGLKALGLTDLMVETQISLSSAASRRGDLDRAGEYLESARERAAQVQDPSVVKLLAQAQNDLEDRLVDSSVTNLGAFRTAGRLEEVVESRLPYDTKLNEVLEIMSQALEADGAALVFSSEFAGASYRIGSVSWEMLRRTLLSRNPERPEIVLDAATAVRKDWTEMVTSRHASSFLVIPINGHGVAAYLYLDRLTERRRSAFGPSHLNLCLALTPQLEALVDRAALESVTGHTEEDSLRRRTFLADVVTQNPEMVEILKLVEKVNRTDLTVLLQGETGTGKTLIARAIHLSSDRAEGRFVTVDCAALPENLLESELFGYVKGAFTGAAHDKKGLFEEADGGTIFLDEVGKAGLGVQRRLLHLLDQGEVRPVGSTSYRKLDVRVICATSKKDLLNQDEEPFIKDLYYRLNDIIIQVPSLRERPEDIPLLAEYFLETFNSQTGRTIPGFNRTAMQRLVRYGWPGNVRELEKAVRRAAILAEDSETVTADLLPREVLNATGNGAAAVESDVDLRSTVEDMERRMVIEALDKHGWNKTRAAQELGLSRKGLKNKIARYDIKPSARI